MRSVTIILLLIAILSVACGSQSTPLPESTTDVNLPMETENIVTQEPEAAPTQTRELTQISEEKGNILVYRIVPGESQLKYEVGETFLNQDNRFNLAVGVSPQVDGEITVDPAIPQDSVIGTITADISKFQSDSARRDNAIRDRFLESSRFPIVTFVPTSIDGIPESYSDGQEISLIISGDLTIRNVTRPVTFETKVRLTEGELSGEATTTILLSDFNIGPISIAGILLTEDEAKVMLMFVARP